MTQGSEDYFGTLWGEGTEGETNGSALAEPPSSAPIASPEYEPVREHSGLNRLGDRVNNNSKLRSKLLTAGTTPHGSILDKSRPAIKREPPKRASK